MCGIEGIAGHAHGQANVGIHVQVFYAMHVEVEPCPDFFER